MVVKIRRQLTKLNQYVYRNAELDALITELDDSIPEEMDYYSHDSLKEYHRLTPLLSKAKLVRQWVIDLVKVVKVMGTLLIASVSLSGIIVIKSHDKRYLQGAAFVDSMVILLIIVAVSRCVWIQYCRVRDVKKEIISVLYKTKSNSISDFDS